MKKIILPIINLIFIFSIYCPQNAGASHVIGSEVTWTSVGEDSFMVSVTVYRDCNGCTIGDVGGTCSPVNLMVKPACDTAVSVGLSVISVEDITPVCDSVCTRCDNSSCTFPFGMQKIVLQGLVYLGNYNCCDFLLSWGECCRNLTTISSNQIFYVESKLSTCNNLVNSSPKFTSPPVLLTCVGQCVILNVAATDDDGDSLVYSLTPPLKAAGTPVSYTGQYSYNKPLYFFGFPNPQLAFNPPQCRGFHLDSLTGELKFRPMQAQVTTMAIKVEEYRNSAKIGEITRDIQLIITNCPSNDVPEISGINGSNTQFSIIACPGERICFDVSSSDRNSNDSVEIFWNSGISGATFNITQNGQYQDGTFCWTPDSAHASNNPHFFTVTAKDNACPIPGTTMRTYLVTVKPIPPVTASISTYVDSCNMVNFYSGIDTAHKNILFEWSGQGGFSSNQPNPVHMYDSAGTYWYYLRVLNTDLWCEAFYDSAQVTVTAPLKVMVNNDTLVCPGSSVLLTATAQNGKPPYNLSWSTGDTTSSINVAPLAGGQYSVLITDSLLCTATGLIKINAYTPYLQVNAGSNFSGCINSDSVQLSGIPAGGSWSGTGVVNDYFYPATAGAGKHLLTYQMPDSNGCIAKDFLQAEVYALPLVSAGPDTAVCTNSPAFRLTETPVGGSWSGSGVSQGQFDPSTAGAGIHNLVYSFTDAKGCINRDTILVTVHPQPMFTTSTPAEICLNAVPALIGTTPTGGTFSGRGVTDTAGQYWFDPAIAGKGSINLTATYTDSNQCTATEILSVQVHGLPVIDPGTYPDVCENGDDVQLAGAPSGGTWSGNAVNGNLFRPAAAGAGSFLLTYTFTDTNNCTVNNSTTIKVNEKPTADFTHTPDSGATPLEVFFINTSSGNNLRYVWFMGDKFNFSTTDKNPSFTYRDTNRTYDVMLIAQDSITGCADTTFCQTCVTVLAPVGIKENFSTKFKVFPNPAQNELTINGDIAIKEVMVTDLSGKTVIKAAVNREKLVKLDLTALAAGTYLVYITTEEGIAVKKVVVGR